ncbi:hypothetical protein B0T26DRAFT_728702 [Lasiosphaeria miniovina]|uniref:Uncharacterized protein n=1 Tax=Lasiosphaeria miniovina TaxID=1954250 RepID=A0AA40DKF2_9PEZI|nr:uncharacterized protein B0T26DRAFT_728702 [Lasiosphaeria miniovina]KAK0706954.1 hypothetical protein B0T26DRAFT_728702 [Lasiosphaeria miniovina]
MWSKVAGIIDVGFGLLIAAAFSKFQPTISKLLQPAPFQSIIPLAVQVGVGRPGYDTRLSCHLEPQISPARLFRRDGRAATTQSSNSAVSSDCRRRIQSLPPKINSFARSCRPGARIAAQSDCLCQVC